MTENENQLINLPVSLGEALDKLTILDIKMNKIKDNRLTDVKNEYTLLYNTLKSYVNNHQFYYNILKKINLDIWEMQDEFRYVESDKDKKSDLCLKIIDDNDRRFRVKKKINDITNSKLKEQKGYTPKKCFILTNLGLGDNITANGLVRYLSTCYDETYVVCKKGKLNNVKEMYSDDDNIKFIVIDYDKDIKIKLSNNEFHNYDKYICGNFCNLQTDNDNIPFTFYNQLKLNNNYFWDYFHIPINQKNLELFSLIKDYDYAFIHNTCSTGLVFNIELVEKKLGIDKDKMLIINPNNNCYDKTHKFYDIADKLLNHLVIDYIEIIKNAKYNILSDSSFMCLAINLDISTDQNYYYSRNEIDYENLYTDNNIYKNINRRRFINLKKY